MMRRIVVVCTVSLLLAGAVLVVAQEKHEKHAAVKTSTANAAFEQLKTLAGDWEADAGEHGKVQANYRVVSSGSCVMETLNCGGSEDMVTVYHRDGDRLMLTHFCAANNQPRMRTDALSGTPKSLAFKFVDASNLADPNEMHMHDLTVTFVDADHFTQEWTHSVDGKVGSPVKFEFARKP